MIEEIKKFKVTHKELFESWRVELDEDTKQLLDMYFPS